MLSASKLLLVLIGFASGARQDRSLDYGTYPTDFFENHVPKFVNNRPMIGIVAMKVSGQKMMVEVPWVSGKDYFGSSFVKFVESAGGRAVPIKEDIPNDDLAKLLRKLNGVIMPGGDADISDSGYSRISKQVVAYSLQEAKKNVSFPVMGICRGFQMILTILAGKDSMVPTDSLNLSIPLLFTKEAPGSRLFGKAPKGILRSLKNLPITFNAHGNGFPAQSFYNDSKLMENVRATSTNYDRNGTHFISTYEARNAPIFGLQWHPEKVLFVYNPVLAVDHTIHAILTSQYIANVFMTEARKNPNHFAGRKDEEEHLIMSHYPTYVGNITETPYEQIYVFEFDNKYTADQEKNQEDDDDDKDEINLVKKSTIEGQIDIPEFANSVKFNEQKTGKGSDEGDETEQEKSLFRGNFRKEYY